MAQLYVLDLVKVMITPSGDETRSGIELEGPYSRPFTVYREWSGPVGYYFEQLVIKQEEEVAFESEPKQIFVRGLQSVTGYTDTVNQRARLKAGPCRVEFLIDGELMAYTEVEAFSPAPAGSLSPTGA